MKYEVISKDDVRYYPIAFYCRDNITIPNLQSNGGILRGQKVVYKGDYLIICKYNNKIVGYNCIVYKEDSLFIRQICVLEEYRKMGVGCNLIEQAIMLAQNVDKVEATVLEYNIPSQHMFEKIGFSKIPHPTKQGWYLFTKELEKKKTMCKR